MSDNNQENQIEGEVDENKQSDVLNESNASTTSKNSRRKKKYAQHYKTDWEELPLFMAWLKKSQKGSSFGYCKCCDKDINITSGKDSLIKHKNSKAHLERVNRVEIHPTFLEIFPDGNYRRVSVNSCLGQSKAMSTFKPENYKFETLLVENPSEFVIHVQLNRPNNLNAMNRTFWREIRECFQGLKNDQDCRAIVLSGNGKAFSAGLDLKDSSSLSNLFGSDLDIGRKANELFKIIADYQESFSSMEKCPKPVIAAIHGPCIGGGVDMITATDIRYCTNDAWFQIKEVDLGMAADVGTLQRLPKIIGSQSGVRELAFTGRKFYASEALSLGLVSRVFPDKDTLIHASLDLAKVIASKSPVAIQGIKVNLNYSRDHNVEDGLNFVARWNMGMLQSEDFIKAVMAGLDKSGKPTEFSKL